MPAKRPRAAVNRANPLRSDGAAEWIQFIDQRTPTENVLAKPMTLRRSPRQLNRPLTEDGWLW
jgi:hypothetical protein